MVCTPMDGVFWTCPACRSPAQTGCKTQKRKVFQPKPLTLDEITRRRAATKRTKVLRKPDKSAVMPISQHAVATARYIAGKKN